MKVVGALGTYVEAVAAASATFGIAFVAAFDAAFLAIAFVRAVPPTARVPPAKNAVAPPVSTFLAESSDRSGLSLPSASVAP